MRTFAVLGCAGLLTIGVVVACAGDDAKHVRNGDGGGAGRGEGGAAGLGQGGGEHDPSLAGGGAAGAVTGGVGATTNGGAPGGSGEGGMSAALGGAGAGGAGSEVVCEREVDTNYQCTEVEANWAPVWNTLQSRLELDVSSLPFPIASGTVSYFINNADFQECGTVDVQVSGDTVYAPVTIANIKLTPTDVRISTFALMDVCGNRRDFDPRGAPACHDLRGEVGFGTTALACSTRLDGTCPEVCD